MPSSIFFRDARIRSWLILAALKKISTLYIDYSPFVRYVVTKAKKEFICFAKQILYYLGKIMSGGSAGPPDPQRKGYHRRKKRIATDEKKKEKRA